MDDTGDDPTIVHSPCAFATTRQQRLDPSPLLVGKPLNPFAHIKAPLWSLESSTTIPR
jgi:hypothetical protein